MASQVSQMSASPPGFVNRYVAKYGSRYRGAAEEKNKELSLVREENNRLRESLTLVQTECEDLRSESNYNRAKVLELSDLVTLSKSPKQKAAMKDSLVAKKKEKENAELILTVNKLEIELYQSELKLEELKDQKKSHNKLLLEMGEVIRALNAVDVDYDPSVSGSSDSESLSPQQLSIRNIKLKVEAMKRDREVLKQKCRLLEGEYDHSRHSKADAPAAHKFYVVDHNSNSNEDKLTPNSIQKKIDALERKIHIVNTSKLEDAATHTTCTSQTVRTTPPHSPYSRSYAASTLTPASMSRDESEFTGDSEQEGSESSAAKIAEQNEEIARCNKELASYMEKEQEHTNEIIGLKQTEQEQKETIQRLADQNETASHELASLTEKLEKAEGENQEIASKRDELRSNLQDIMVHHKELTDEHEAAQQKIRELQSRIDILELRLRVATRREEPAENNEESIEEDEELQSLEEDEISVAYRRAKNRIKELELHLIKAGQLLLSARAENKNAGRHYQTTIHYSQKMERERDELQTKLDKAMEEMRLAKLEVQKERDASDEARRKLADFSQQRQDDRSVSSGHSRASARKKPAFRPLTLLELMEKDFS